MDDTTKILRKEMEGGTPGSTSSMNKIPKMQISSDKEEEKDDFFLATS